MKHLDTMLHTITEMWDAYGARAECEIDARGTGDERNGTAEYTLLVLDNAGIWRVVARGSSQYIIGYIQGRLDEAG